MADGSDRTSRVGRGCARRPSASASRSPFRTGSRGTSPAKRSSTLWRRLPWWVPPEQIVAPEGEGVALRHAGDTALVRQRPSINAPYGSVSYRGHSQGGTFDANPYIVPRSA